MVLALFGNSRGRGRERARVRLRLKSEKEVRGREFEENLVLDRSFLLPLNRSEVPQSYSYSSSPSSSDSLVGAKISKIESPSAALPIYSKISAYGTRSGASDVARDNGRDLLLHAEGARPLSRIDQSGAYAGRAGSDTSCFKKLYLFFRCVLRCLMQHSINGVQVSSGTGFDYICACAFAGDESAATEVAF